MKRFFLPLLALAALFAGSYVLLVGSEVSAQSSFDNPSLTDKLYVGSNISKTDVTMNYMQLFAEAWPNTNFNVFNDDNYWWITNEYVNIQGSSTWAIQVSWIPKSDLGHCSYGNRQYASQWENTNDFMRTSYYCTLNKFDNYQWFGVYRLSDDSPVQQHSSHENGNTGYGMTWGYEITDDWKIGQSPQNWYPAISINKIFPQLPRPSGWQNVVESTIYIANAPFQNPNNGETDVEAPSQGGSGEEKEIRRPQFTYQQNNRSLTVNPYLPEPVLPDFSPELDEGYTFVDYYVNWTLWKCPDGGFDPVGQVCNNGSPTLIQTELKPNEEQFTFNDIEEYGTYQVEAEFWAQQCYRYPSYPATPDHCFYSALRAHFDDEPFDYVNTYVVLEMDGRASIGDTSGMVCTVGGHCQPASAVCHDQPNFVASMNCRMQGPLSIGIINPSINAVKKLANSIIVPMTPQCSIPLSNIKIAQTTLPLSNIGTTLCATTDKVHHTFPFVRIIVNALMALAILGFIIYRINLLLNNEKNDILEQV